MADANVSESGHITTENFNIWLERTELNILRFLTGDLVDNREIPMPFDKQKCKDYLKKFITSVKANNIIPIPEDYYYWDNLYKFGTFSDDSCEPKDEAIEQCNTPIEILDGQEFNSRCNSYVKGIKPSQGSPIAKIIDNKIVTAPKEVGSMCLEYIRYPKFGKLITKIDLQFNEEIVDIALSTDLEWDIWAKEYIIWGIVNLFSKHTREKALKEFNTTDKPKG